MKMPRTRERQYQFLLDYRDSQGLETMGLMSSQSWYDDPRRLGFMLARYKFVSKMFAGFDSALEVGCGDGFGARIVRQEVKRLTAVDFDPEFVADAKAHMRPRWRFEVKVHDMLKGPVPGLFRGIYALDVLEHIRPGHEHAFLANMVKSLAPHGSMIIGMPSLESQAYASPQSKAGHVNCQTQAQLRATMARHFRNVFMFTMNDEVLGTGYAKMAHYLFALCASPRARPRRPMDDYPGR